MVKIKIKNSDITKCWQIHRETRPHWIADGHIKCYSRKKLW